MKKTSAHQGSLIAREEEESQETQAASTSTAPMPVPPAPKNQKTPPNKSLPPSDGRPTHISPSGVSDSLKALNAVIEANLSDNKRQYELLTPPPASGNDSPFVTIGPHPDSWPQGWCSGWSYTPPPGMSEILDVRLTPRRYTPKGEKESKEVMVWTQGSNFSVSEGHVIYRSDCMGVYEGTWAEAMMKLPLVHCLQVIEASPVAPSAIVKKTFFPLLEPPSAEKLEVLMAEIREEGNIPDYRQGPNPENRDEKGWLLSERAWRDPGSVTFATMEKQNGRLVKTGRHTVTQDDFVRFLITGRGEWL